MKSSGKYLQGLLLWFVFFFCSQLSAASEARAQAAVFMDLPPALSADGLSVTNAVAPLVIVADPDPNAQGIKVEGFSSAQALVVPNAAAATFSITYVAAGGTDLWNQECTDFPAGAKTAFQAATAIWANQFQSSVPVTIKACWASLASPSTLGYSGGGTSHRDFVGAPRAGTWYSAALANSLAGSDLDAANHDMHITYNSNFSWYFGTDGQPPLDQHDLVTVAAHEIAHGLNFAGSAKYSAGVGSYGGGTGFPNIYDTYMRDGAGVDLTSYTNSSTSLGSLLKSGNLWFHGTNAMAANGGLPAKIYAPSTWADGSSYSHLDYATFNGTANSMMVYAIGAGSANHNPGAVTVGLLKDLGWQAASATCAPPPSLKVPAADADGNYSISWGASATVGVTYELQEATNSVFTNGLRTIDAGAALSVDITGRLQNRTYYYRVRAVKSGATSSAWRYVVNGCAVPGIAKAGVPASLTVPTADVDGAYLVSWGASVTAGVVYELVEATNGAFSTGLRSAYRGTGTSCNITGRSQNVTYYYRVRAVKSGLKDSDYQTRMIGCAVPGSGTVGIPASLTVPNADMDGNYSISWGASSTADVFYELQEATNSLFTAGLQNIYRGTALSANITGRSQNATYYYRVRAVKGGLKDSGYRNGVNSCAVPGLTTVGAPTSLIVPVADVEGGYPVSWGASATAGVIYELQEATASTFSTGLRIAYRGTATSCGITGRSQNMTYYYRVRAVKGGLKDSAYRGSNGCAVPGTVTAAIPASLTVPSSDSDGTYLVSWGGSATAEVIYELVEATNSAFTIGYRIAYRGPATSCNIAKRYPGNTYYYQVRAVKAGLRDSAYRTAGNGCAIMSLANALDNSSYNFSTGGNAYWSYQTTTSYIGGDAAQSGVTLANGSSWMQTTVTGPGTASFFWKVSSENSFDYLRFYIDGVEQVGSISGEVDWVQKSFVLGSGSHVLKWAYTKDDAVSGGNDAGWVDNFVVN